MMKNDDLLVKHLDSLSSNLNELVRTFERNTLLGLMKEKMHLHEIIPIVIEGLDCSGKETLAKKIYRTLKEKGELVHMQSFPDYNVDTGQRIYKYLREKHQYPEYAFLSDMILNRLGALVDIRDKYNTEENTGKTLYLILDRFAMSNYAYNRGDDGFNSAFRDACIYESKVLFNLINPNQHGFSIIISYNKGRDEYAMLSDREMYNRSIARHKEVLDSKADKDTNETIEKQIEISKFYDIPNVEKDFNIVNNYIRLSVEEALDSNEKDYNMMLTGLVDTIKK